MDFSQWRSLLVICAVGFVAWWIWRKYRTKPEVAMQSNDTPAPKAPAGIPVSLTEKMAMLVDTQIPVVMTSGTPMQYDDDEVQRIVKSLLARLNDMGENTTLIAVTSASKTQDSYKTVMYDITANVYDAKANIGVMVVISILLPISGKTYVREFRLFHAPEPSRPALQAASELAEPASFDTPLKLLSMTRP